MSLSDYRITRSALIGCATIAFIISLSAKARPLRIITLAPNLTEIVYALGAGHDLFGVMEHSDFPPQARK
ncbi:MAG: Vitamin B12-binding protein [Candidatus Celerinatantimonas neptuna]|nr:MAG: Vitamin B12-binding protein [Candidatus Celerinatantimonas neptuna]